MKPNAMLVVPIAFVSCVICVGSAIADWTIGNPQHNSVYPKTSTIGCTGLAPGSGYAFSVELRDFDNNPEQSEAGTTTAPPMMPMLGMWSANLVPPGPANEWNPDTVMPPGPGVPMNGFTTAHRVILRDAAGELQKQATVFISP